MLSSEELLASLDNTSTIPLHTCGGELWRGNVEGNCGGELWKGIVEGNCGGEMWKGIVEGNCGRELWREIVEGNCGRGIVEGIVRRVFKEDRVGCWFGIVSICSFVSC